MANKAAVDFGNSNTVLALWNEKTQQSEVLRIPEYAGTEGFLIPSVISYEPDGHFFIGAQAGVKASADAKLFRWMKRYIGLRSPYSLRVGADRIDAKRAAEDFLTAVTAASFSEVDTHPDELILSVPVDSFEHYSQWLLGEMPRLENMHIRLIDEASAAAAGYGLKVHPGDSLLVLDFGGSTLQAVCVSITEDGPNSGLCCRVLGKAGRGIGGMTLDRWIYEDVLKRLQISENDNLLRNCSGALLRYCETVKKQLSVHEEFLFGFFPEKPFLLRREDMDRLFRGHGLPDALDSVIGEAIRGAEDHGLVRDKLTAVIPVGGSCLLLQVREHLESCFSGGKVAYGEPLGAVARGAAVIAGGMHIYDFIQHNYAIRYTDPQTGSYAFRTIVSKGTKYPIKQVTGEMRLKATYDGQQRFGIAIYELRDGQAAPAASNEIFFDAEGAVHVMPLTQTELQAGEMFWMNERNPLFLRAEIPGERSIPCFLLSFGINENKMLTVSAVDLLREVPILTDQPVVRLV